MDKEDNYTDKITGFVLRRLPAAEMEEIEKKIQNDPAFALEVKIVRLQVDAAKTQFDLDLENQIAAWDREAMLVEKEGIAGQREKKNLRDFFKSPWVVLAIVALLTGGFFLAQYFRAPGEQKISLPPIVTDPGLPAKNDTSGLSAPSSPDRTPPLKDVRPAKTKNTDLQAARYLGQPHLSAGEVMSEAPENPLTQGLRAFRQKNYEQAYQYWNDLALSDENYRAFAWHGMAYAAFQLALQAKNEQERSNYLDRSQQLSESLLKDEDMEQAWPHIRWNLLLITLVREGENSAGFRQKAKEFDSVPEFRQEITQLRKALEQK